MDEWYERYQTHYNRVAIAQTKVNESYLALKVLIVNTLDHLDPLLVEKYMPDVEKYDDAIVEFSEALFTWANDFGELHNLSQLISDEE